MIVRSEPRIFSREPPDGRRGGPPGALSLPTIHGKPLAPWDARRRVWERAPGDAGVRLASPERVHSSDDCAAAGFAVAFTAQPAESGGRPMARKWHACRTVPEAACGHGRRRVRGNSPLHWHPGRPSERSSNALGAADHHHCSPHAQRSNGAHRQMMARGGARN